MESSDTWRQNSRRIADYFVVCGLPTEPQPYDYSKVIAHGDEIIIPDKPVDFTAYSLPIIDIEFISLKDGHAPPLGFHVIRNSHSGKFKANISRIGEEVYLGYRLGREKPPITNISIFSEGRGFHLKTGARKITETINGKNAKLKLVPPTYLSYTRASPSAGIDQLAVIDMCIIFPSKHETCPPAYIQLPDSLTSNLFGGNAYLCFRKALVKEHTIAYQPKVLFWYRVPPPISADLDESSSLCDGPVSASVPEKIDSNTKLDEFSLDHDIQQVAEFCLPWGAMIESWSVEQDFPQFNSFLFVLTNGMGERLYGVAFTFHEPYDINQLDLDKCYRLGVDPELVPKFSKDPASDELNPEEEAEITSRQKHFLRSRVGDRVIGVTKALCLLSRCSFPTAFTNFLAFLHSRCYPGMNNGSVPLERYLTYFLCEVPFPDQHSPNIMVELCAAPILLESPDDQTSSSSCEPFYYMLSFLGVDLTIKLFIHVLTEQKILLTSVHHFLLAQIGEALTSMIYPLQWAAVYIPFIYMGHIHVIQSPSPYLIGMDSRFFDFFRLPLGATGVTYVDLDTKNFIPAVIPDQPVLDEKLLPKKPLNILRATLAELFKEIKDLKDNRRKDSTSALLRSLFTEPGTELANEELNSLQAQWFGELSAMAAIGHRIKTAFVQCMAWLLRGYRDFVISVHEAERDRLFDSEAFLEHIGDDRSRPLYTLLLNTQHWVNFIRDRSYVSPRDEELADFDNLIDSMSDERSLSTSSLALSESLACNADAAGTVPDGSFPMIGSVGLLSAAAADVSVLRSLAQGQWNSDQIRIIGPPAWPVSLESQTMNTTAGTSPDSHTPSVDLVPTQWNSRLLDQLSTYSRRLQYARENCAIPDPTTACRSPPTLPVNPAYSASSNSLNSGGRTYLSNGWRFLPDHIRALPGQDSPSPALSRSVTAAPVGLTGLPTDYPLPAKNSLILKRSVLELKYSAELGRYFYQCHGLQWAKWLIGSMYSVWFMLLPSYLASLYMYAQQSATMRDSDMAMTVLHSCLAESVAMAQRIREADIPCEDQVIFRVLLVLLYQHRPPQFPLLAFIKHVQWNPTSTGLANHVYKACEKEYLDAERLKREREQEPSSILSHRRSASACCMLTPPPPPPPAIPPVDSVPIRADQGDAQTPHRRTSDITTTPIPTTIRNGCTDQPSGLTHKRSNSSSTATCVVPNLRAQPVGQLTKSETDSGLYLGCGAMEDIPEPVVRAASQMSTIDGEQPDPHRNQHDSLVRVNPAAPLASLDEDLTDLGYSTLNRPPVDATQNPGKTDQTGVSSQAKPCMQQEPTTQHLDPPLEPVQKSSPAEWFEPERTEIRPIAHASSNQAQPVTPPNHPIERDPPSTTDSDRSNSSDGDESVESQRSVSRGQRQSNRGHCSQGSKESRRIPTALHQASSESSTESTSGIFSGPRGSIDHLTNALSALGTSQLTNKVMQSVRGLLAPLNRSLSGTPNPGRRTSVAERLLPSTPNSARLPRDMRRWTLRSSSVVSAGNDSNTNGNSENSQPDQMWAEAQENGSNSIYTELLNLQLLSHHIAGALSIGPPYRSCYPANVATQLLSAAPAHPNPPRSPKSTQTTCSSDQPGSPSTETRSSERNVVRLTLLLTTCTTCPSCSVSVHDEEIMASWSCNEDRYYITCPFCHDVFVPQLTVHVLGHTRDVQPTASPAEREPRRSCSNHSIPENGHTQNHTSPVLKLLEFSHPYLSPLVLRKALETVVQRDGDDCFRQTCVHPKQTMLYRHEPLVWNLVWYAHRLGLPTHMLDHFPTWLAELQAQTQYRLAEDHANAPVPSCKLSPDVPVYVSLRWNAFPVAQGTSHQPLYKLWQRRKNDFTAEWMLVPTKPGSCHMETTVARAVNAIYASDMHGALDALVRFRASVLRNMPLSTVIHPSTSHKRGQPDHTKMTSAASSSPRVQPRRDQCTDSHQYAWCVDQSLYRELLFLSLNALDPRSLLLVNFDLGYKKAFDLMRGENNRFISDSDCAPDLIASACRQMLYPLMLN